MTRTAAALNEKGLVYIMSRIPDDIDPEVVMTAIEGAVGFMDLAEGEEYLADEAGVTFTITSDMVRWEEI